MKGINYFRWIGIEAELRTCRIVQTIGHVEYDMGKYDWEGIADEVGEVYNGLR